jgi:hypothetical protein
MRAEWVIYAALTVYVPICGYLTWWRWYDPDALKQILNALLVASIVTPAVFGLGLFAIRERREALNGPRGSNEGIAKIRALAKEVGAPTENPPFGMGSWSLPTPDAPIEYGPADDENTKRLAERINVQLKLGGWTTGANGVPAGIAETALPGISVHFLAGPEGTYVSREVFEKRAATLKRALESVGEHLHVTVSKSERSQTTVGYITVGPRPKTRSVEEPVPFVRGPASKLLSNRDALRVYDGTTNDLLPGKPHESLINVSIQPGGDGMASAWFVDGVWTHEQPKVPGDAREVYVSDRAEPKPPGWRRDPPKYPLEPK